MPIGLLRIIEKPTVFLLVTEYYLIMKDLKEVKHLLQEKLQEQLQKFILKKEELFIWAILMPKRLGIRKRLY